MSDDAAEVLFIEGGVIDIDADKIAAIVFATCHTSEARAAKAANRVVEYLIDAFNDAKMRTQQ